MIRKVGDFYGFDWRGSDYFLFLCNEKLFSMKYDIFISYRRKDSSGKSNVPTARQFKLAFEAPPYNYKVFFDYSECTDNYFSDIILPAIRTCDFFVLVLTKDCLLRCSNEGDWVRREIEEAIASGKKIIPITPDKECESFPSDLPDSIKKVFNELQITTIYTDHMFESGVEFLVKNRFHLDDIGLVGRKDTLPRTNCPEGAINGVFSVSPVEKVYFSKGNLQYQASTGVWRFAERQYDIIGEANKNISPNYNGWIDLFGWGTGDDPTKNTIELNDYQKFTDWGDNSIINGGAKKKLWYTLSPQEWEYVLFKRITHSGLGKRFANAMIGEMRCLIILPDNWNSTTYRLRNVDRQNASFEDNQISVDEWIILESAGAVLLPAAGMRADGSVRFLGDIGEYHTTTGSGGGYRSLVMCFTGGQIYFPGGYRYHGDSVRLVRSA